MTKPDQPEETPPFDHLLLEFSEFKSLRRRVLHVLGSLPREIQTEFLGDPYFRISLDKYEPGKGRTVLMPLMCPEQGESRCVVLKPKLDQSDEQFAHYIIAHEFAHSILRNGGWGEITDREDAADALAKSWGFEKPSGLRSFWF